MIRRINYTGRQRISRDDVKIVVYEKSGSSACFEAKLDLASYDLPADAIVFVEAYRQTFLMRFDFGTCLEIEPPSERFLTEFESTEGILFRVKATSQSPEQGKLLAEADRIPFRRAEEEDEERVPLLPVRSEDLGYVISKVDFTDRPELLVNSSLGDWRGAAISPVFVSLIYPQALREILTRILRIEGYHDTDDPEDWRSKWLRYSTLLPGIAEPPEEDEEAPLDDWIDEVVAAFSKKNEILQKYQTYWKGEQSE
jgi:hypothetical protein